VGGWAAEEHRDKHIQCKSSYTRWGLGKGIPRQPYPWKIPLKFCKEAASNPGPPGHREI